VKKERRNCPHPRGPHRVCAGAGTGPRGQRDQVDLDMSLGLAGVEDGVYELIVRLKDSKLGLSTDEAFLARRTFSDFTCTTSSSSSFPPSLFSPPLSGGSTREESRLYVAGVSVSEIYTVPDYKVAKKQSFPHLAGLSPQIGLVILAGLVIEICTCRHPFELRSHVRACLHNMNSLIQRKTNCLIRATRLRIPGFFRK